MSKSLLTAVCFALVAVTGSLRSASKASASEYGSFVLHNPTGMAINYQVRWGTGDWKDYTVQPSEMVAHYYDLDSNGYCPPPQLRFDFVGGDDQVSDLIYDLDVYAVNDPTDGKDYVFQFTSDGRFINLFAE